MKSGDSPELRELSKRLKAINEGLTYEMSVHEADFREIIISGDGVKEMIPFVREVVAAAPDLQGWKVIAFRPRMEAYANNKLTYLGEEFDPQKLWFHPMTSDGAFDIILYHPAYTKDRRNQIAAGIYILMDTALGEFDVMTKIRYIDFQKTPKDPDSEGLVPFTKLRDVFDTFYQGDTEQGRGANALPHVVHD